MARESKRKHNYSNDTQRDGYDRMVKSKFMYLEWKDTNGKTAYHVEKRYALYAHVILKAVREVAAEVEKVVS